MKSKKNRIRTRVLAVISIIQLSTLSLTGILFNIAAWRYIESSAIAQLDRSFNAIQESRVRTGTFVLEFPRELLSNRPFPLVIRGNDFRIEANMFVIDAEYNPLANQLFGDNSNSLEILEAIKDRGLNLDDIKNKRINTAHGVYYVSAHHLAIANTNESAYWVIYADTTGLTNFAHTINVFLIILVCIMFIAAALIAFFLSNSITRPIQKLCTLASNIGRGDFTPNDYCFTDSELEDLNTTLNKTAKQLGVYDSEQKMFFQNVSHELRTPLMSIQCYAEGISFGLMEPKKASETILQETARLNEMVQDLLYISKIDNITPAYAAKNVDLIETIRECVRRQQPLADKNHISFSLAFDDTAVYCECAPELISRAVENLVSNAIRYAKEEIAISCRKIAGQIAICVTDDGSGIKPEEMPHIFERFYKGADGNHGIGLSVVKSIIEQHGGTVRAENTIESGAMFTITLPCEKLG